MVPVKTFGYILTHFSFWSSPTLLMKAMMFSCCAVSADKRDVDPCLVTKNFAVAVVFRCFISALKTPKTSRGVVSPYGNNLAFDGSSWTLFFIFLKSNSQRIFTCAPVSTTTSTNCPQISMFRLVDCDTLL